MDPHPLRKHIDEMIQPLSDDEFNYILNFFKPLKRNKNQFLVQEGESVNKEFWIVKGCLKSCFFDCNGKEHILSFAMENWWVTDYEAFHKRTNATVSINCLEDCDLLYITYEDRERLGNEMHKMEKFWAKKTKFGYIALQNRILTLLKDPAKERFEKLVAQYPLLIQRVPKKLIASYLGVSRETLSRLY